MKFVFLVILLTCVSVSVYAESATLVIVPEDGASMVHLNGGKACQVDHSTGNCEHAALMAGDTIFRVCSSGRMCPGMEQQLCTAGFANKVLAAGINYLHIKFSSECELNQTR